MDKYYGNVCELDIIFNFQKAYFILDELLLAGEMQESSKKNVLRCITQEDSLEDMEVSMKFLLPYKRTNDTVPNPFDLAVQARSGPGLPRLIATFTMPRSRTKSRRSCNELRDMSSSSYTRLLDITFL